MSAHLPAEAHQAYSAATNAAYFPAMGTHDGFNGGGRATDNCPSRFNNGFLGGIRGIGTNAGVQARIPSSAWDLSNFPHLLSVPNLPLLCSLSPELTGNILNPVQFPRFTSSSSQRLPSTSYWQAPTLPSTGQIQQQRQSACQWPLNIRDLSL